MNKIDLKNYADIIDLKNNIEQHIDTFSVEYAIEKVYPKLMKSKKFSVQNVIDYMTIKIMELDSKKEWLKDEIGEEYID